MTIRPLFTRSAGRALLLALAWSSAQAVPEDQFMPAWTSFIQATGGRSSAIEPAAEAFESLVRQEPGNPVLLAYAGAATAMRANTTLLPWRKMRHAEDGLAQIDKALAMLTTEHRAPLQHGAPAVLDVKLVAANTFLAMPSFMNRSARGSKLLNEVLGDPLLAGAPLTLRGSAWMAAGELALREKRNADARTWFGLVVQAQAPQADAARLALKELGQ